MDIVDDDNSDDNKDDNDDADEHNYDNERLKTFDVVNRNTHCS